MAFVKLDCGILDSSLWAEAAEVRIVFITILAMCGPDGMCEGTAPGIARRANMTLKATLRAIEILEAPDPHSRTKAFKGRRVKRVDGGYLVLNYGKYREKDHTAAERKRRQRERERLSRRDIVTVTQAEAEAYVEADAENEQRNASPSESQRPEGASCDTDPDSPF